jgi:hypothetical protein
MHFKRTRNDRRDGVPGASRPLRVLLLSASPLRPSRRKKIIPSGVRHEPVMAQLMIFAAFRRVIGAVGCAGRV